MDDLHMENATEDKREEIKQKLRQYYDGRIVRKDLTKSIREGANVPVYVLEYLLGQVLPQLSVIIVISHVPQLCFKQLPATSSIHCTFYHF